MRYFELTAVEVGMHIGTYAYRPCVSHLKLRQSKYSESVISRSTLYVTALFYRRVRKVLSSVFGFTSRLSQQHHLDTRPLHTVLSCSRRTVCAVVNVLYHTTLQREVSTSSA